MLIAYRDPLRSGKTIELKFKSSEEFNFRNKIADYQLFNFFIQMKYKTERFKIHHPVVSIAAKCMLAILWFIVAQTEGLAQLKAGTGKIDITERNSGPVNDPLFARALALDDGSTRMVIITLDVVAIEEIGPIKTGYLDQVRARLQKELKIEPRHVVVNASHCHGVVRKDVADLTVEAVHKAFSAMEEVTVGVGKGFEDRIMENRRVYLKDGSQADMRRAYPMPADDKLEAVGPVDPQIGVLRFNRKNGTTKAIIYNFAIHPIQGVPHGGNTADLIGYASKVIEDNLDKGTVALFLQGCGGDVNPIGYKNVDTPPDAERLGNLLGLSTLKAIRSTETKAVRKIGIKNEKAEFPRADFRPRIERLEDYRKKLLAGLRGTNINFKTFLPTLIKQKANPEFPSTFAQGYLHEKTQGKYGWAKLDSINRMDVENYMFNIYTMEELVRVNTNLALLKKHQADGAGKTTIPVEIVGLKIGDFALVTYPGELTVQIGLNLKKMSPHHYTFVAGYTNGYTYYAPTAAQLNNSGVGQEDCDTILAPEWHLKYEEKALEVLKNL